jgi:hypothetical protein
MWNGRQTDMIKVSVAFRYYRTQPNMKPAYSTCTTEGEKFVH